MRLNLPWSAARANIAAAGTAALRHEVRNRIRLIAVCVSRFTFHVSRFSFHAFRFTFYAALLGLPVTAATLHESFSSDPQAGGWRIFGDTNLFSWNSTNQNLEVTWDSSQSNSYFQLPLGTILTRQDDFSFALDLRLDDIMAGANPDKPGTFELAFGFQNIVDAQKTNFLRGTGRNSPNLVEFDFFPAADAVQATVSPAFWSTNSTLSYNGAGDFTIMDLPLGMVMQVTMSYASSNQTITTTITTNGVPVATVHAVKSARISPIFASAPSPSKLHRCRPKRL